jgi:hypothetical protein
MKRQQMTKWKRAGRKKDIKLEGTAPTKAKTTEKSGIAVACVVCPRKNQVKKTCIYHFIYDVCIIHVYVYISNVCVKIRMRIYVHVG